MLDSTSPVLFEVVARLGSENINFVIVAEDAIELRYIYLVKYLYYVS